MNIFILLLSERPQLYGFLNNIQNTEKMKNKKLMFVCRRKASQESGKVEHVEAGCAECGQWIGSYWGRACKLNS